ncbi:hypothetical protein ABK040_001000 [Willaertia magna]
MDSQENQKQFVGKDLVSGVDLKEGDLQGGGTFKGDSKLSEGKAHGHMNLDDKGGIFTNRGGDRLARNIAQRHEGDLNENK